MPSSAAENQFAAGIVEHLPGHSVKMDSRFEAADGAEIKRKKIEEQRTFGFGGKRDHLALCCSAVF